MLWLDQYKDNIHVKDQLNKYQLLDGVEIMGTIYPTINKDGIERFMENPDNALLKKVFLCNYDGFNDYDMNLLAMMYHKGEISLKDHAEALMSAGYSVSGFMDLSTYDEILDVENYES